MDEKHTADKSHVMVGDCPVHGLVAGDAIDGEFPSIVYCDECGNELESCIAAPSEKVAENDDVTENFA